MPSKTQKRSFACPFPGCSKVYRTSFGRSRHELCHYPSRWYECSVCAQRFAVKQYLRDHLIEHTGLKPYSCQAPGCRKAFTTSGQLSRHRAAHKARAEPKPINLNASPAVGIHLLNPLAPAPLFNPSEQTLIPSRQMAPPSSKIAPVENLHHGPNISKLNPSPASPLGMKQPTFALIKEPTAASACEAVQTRNQVLLQIRTQVTNQASSSEDHWKYNGSEKKISNANEDDYTRTEDGPSLHEMLFGRLDRRQAAQSRP